MVLSESTGLLPVEASAALESELLFSGGDGALSSSPHPTAKPNTNNTDQLVVILLMIIVSCTPKYEFS